MKLLIPISLALLSFACVHPKMVNDSKATNCNNCAVQCATCAKYKFVQVTCGPSGTAMASPSTFPVPQGEQFSWQEPNSNPIAISPLTVQFQGANPCNPFNAGGGCQVAASPGTYSYQVSVNGCQSAGSGTIQVTK